MYFVALAGRNYSILIKVRAALGGKLAVFESRLESCNGELFPVNCDVNIAYYYVDVGSNAGYRFLTLLSGSSSVSEQPTGNTLTTLYISSLTGSGCTAYSEVVDCPAALPTTTTTTTTTTSTTSTTTTTSPSDPGQPAIKFDQVSGSYNSGTGTWTNIGTSGSVYNLTKPTGPTITAGGSGDAAYLDLTGLLSGPENDQIYIAPLLGSFINLYNTSFSYSIVFQHRDNPPTYFDVYNPTVYNGFRASTLVSFNSFTNTSTYYIQPQIYSRDFSNSSTSFPKLVANKWYLLTMVFDKTWSDGNRTVLYLNTLSNQMYIQNASTFFKSVNNYGHVLSTNPSTARIAAVLFWQNKVLTQQEVQFVCNEYNRRYTLG